MRIDNLQRDRRYSGNALFLVLIAVALFAALSYAITRTGRGTGSITKEQASLTASNIYSLFGDIEQGISRVHVLGCADNQITLENNIYRGGPGDAYVGAIMLPVGSNTNAPADKRCHVFDKAGGGAVPVVIKNATGPHPTAEDHSWAYWGWPEPGHPWFITQAVPGIGTSAPDIVASIHYVPKEVCDAYDKLIGLSTPVLDSAMGDWIDPPQFIDGTYPNTYGSGWGAGMVPGTKTWCLDSQDSHSSYHIFFVVYER